MRLKIEHTDNNGKHIYVLENYTIEDYRAIGTKIIDGDEQMIPLDPFMIITANMPKGLKKDIDKLVKDYCNH